MAKICKKYSGIGGQAVMEGIMMKNKDRYAVAVRKPNGDIEVMTDEYKGICANMKLTKLPFVRGVFNFIDSLVLGLNTLSWSASFFDDEEGEKKDKDSNGDKPVSEGLSGFMMASSIILSLIMAIGLFMMLPYFMSELVRKLVDNDLIIAIFEGVIRLAIFVAYVSLISLMKDIKRVYQYHGAEHKCINCIERGYELNVKNVMKASRLHMRCGTSFLLFVMFISIILFMFIRTDNPMLRIIMRLVLVPVVAGISYEIIRLAGKSDNILVRLISAPGLALQKITTREPDEQMVEVAIKAVEAVFDWRAYFVEAFGATEYENAQE